MCNMLLLKGMTWLKNSASEHLSRKLTIQGDTFNLHETMTSSYDKIAQNGLKKVALHRKISEWVGKIFLNSLEG